MKAAKSGTSVSINTNCVKPKKFLEIDAKNLLK